MSEINLIEGKLLERAQMEFCEKLQDAVDRFIEETGILFSGMDFDESEETVEWLKNSVDLHPCSLADTVRYERKGFFFGFAPDLPEGLSRALLRREVDRLLRMINDAVTVEGLVDGLRERGVKV